MPKAHTHGQSRICGATTIVQGQSTVYVNGQLWAVLGDPDTHSGGGLINSGTTVFIGGKPVIVHAPDNASPDALCPLGPDHCNPKTAQGSSDVFAYG